MINIQIKYLENLNSHNSYKTGAFSLDNSNDRRFTNVIQSSGML